jgi:hypothetical protein
MVPAYPSRREMASKEEKMRFRIVLFFVLVSTFALGYGVRTVTTPVVATTHASSACPVGQHPVVWYTARTWACEGNS